MVVKARVLAWQGCPGKDVALAENRPPGQEIVMEYALPVVILLVVAAFVIYNLVGKKKS